MKQSLLDLDNAYQRFFKKQSEFPVFKKKSDVQSIRFPEETVSKTPFNEKGELNLVKSLHGLKFECSDEYKSYLYSGMAKIKSITITKTKTNKYYASILVDGPIDKQTDEPVREFIGLDPGIKTHLTCSDGTVYENKHQFKKQEKKIKKLQKQLSKKVKGSNNRTKARIKLAKAHEKVVNQKLDNMHNMTSSVVNKNHIIILETLNVAGMMKCHNLAKAIQEVNLGEMKRQIKYKAEWHGRIVIEVDRFFPSSKLCSKCGKKHTNLKLSDRVFICPHCGFTIDRDLNASLNLEKEGIRLYKLFLGTRLPECTLVDYPPMDDRTSNGILKSCGRVKQENEIF